MAREKGTSDRAEQDGSGDELGKHHDHKYDTVIDNPADPPRRKVCDCGDWKPLEDAAI